MTAPVRLYARHYGTGSRWRVEFGDTLSIESADRAVVLPVAEFLAARYKTTLDAEPAPEQLALDVDAEADRGIALALAGTSAAWAAECDKAIEILAARGRPFTSYDLLSLGLAEPAHPNQWGPRLQRAARRGVIRADGTARSARPTTRRSLLTIWVGTTELGVTA